MLRIRPSLPTRWLVLSLLTVQLGFLPSGLLAACACAGETCAGQGSCCATASQETGESACCCNSAASSCCQVEPLATSCCAGELIASNCGPLGNCACCVTPAKPASSQPPRQQTAEKETKAVSSPVVIAQLPVVVAAIHDGCQLPHFGPPARGPAIQIAFCIWRN
ncbi:hypothetical protein ETAA8_61140 [Anatilimnocola aggregata]|uniref:Uncharacterized protein n=1 Tax=Anatilimnocola aggregata TaxID=2528021 RepID=A0A517YL58_9BACT|nr:hypothetical protein ETAA8_61140 [Anatilimnocola aggregata]